WDGLVRGLMKIEKCSYSRAVDLAMGTEEGRAVFAKRKRDDQVKTGQFSIADMECLDWVAAEQDYHSELHKRDLKTEYEAECGEGMRRSGQSLAGEHRL